jgi:hypothetical protein
MRRLRAAWLAGALLGVASVATAQTPPPKPVPFPRPTDPSTLPPKAPTPSPEVQTPAPAPAAGEPTEAMLGVPIYPGAQFLASFDAGKGQRYYLYGTLAPFNDIVNYYKAVLKQRGELVFDEPAMHMFELGRFREETMAFPPGITVKDYTWNGSSGYLNPKRGAKPERFPTVIQIVPLPAATPR